MSEFAPGIPSRHLKELPRISSPQEMRLAIQSHKAKRAGQHYDLRIVDDKSGKAYSWAVKNLPTNPGDKTLAVLQPTHTAAYSTWEGKIESGYGAGDVSLFKQDKIEVLKAEPSKITFNVYKSNGDTERFAMINTAGDDWLFHNVTPTRQTRPEIPTSKPSYKSVDINKLDPTKKHEIWAPKIDGALNVFLLRKDKPIETYSYRPSIKSENKIIDHTFRLPYYSSKVPKALKGSTVVLGEVFARNRDGEVLPSTETSARLLSNVWRSRELQQNAPLDNVVYNVLRYQGRDVSNKPYREKLELLKRITASMPQLKLPPLAQNPEQKVELLKTVQEGTHPLSREGIVVYDLDQSTPMKSKITEDYDVHVRDIFPGEGKYKGKAAGGFTYSHTAEGPIAGNVGGGFSDEIRKQMWEHPELWKGQVARVFAQQKLPSGALRMPIFKDIRPEMWKKAFASRSEMLSHAIKRATERFPGLRLNANHMTHLATKIRNGQARFIKHLDGNSAQFEVMHGENTIPVIYNRTKQVISTVLPPHAVTLTKKASLLHGSPKQNLRLLTAVESRFGKKIFATDSPRRAIRYMGNGIGSKEFGEYRAIIDATPEKLVHAKGSVYKVPAKTFLPDMHKGNHPWVFSSTKSVAPISEQKHESVLKSWIDNKLVSVPSKYIHTLTPENLRELVEQQKYLLKKGAVQLLPYQEDLKKRLQKQHGVVVTWGLGSGKTIGSIAAADQFGDTKAVVPASLRENFKKELKAYKPKSHFDVESYEKFVKNPQGVAGKTVIFDEAHRLRTSGSKRSQAAQALSSQAKKVVLLTGTPIQNAPHEIAPLVNIAAGNRVLPTSEKDFNARYLKHIVDKPGFIRRMFGAKNKDEYHINNAEDFAHRVKPYIVHASRATNKELPKVESHNVDVEMSGLQSQIYKTVEKKLPGSIRKSIESSMPAEKRDIGRLNAFLSATRQISNTGDKFYREDGNSYSPKIEKIVDRVRKNPGKSLIYSNYLESGARPISDLLTKYKIPHGTYTGGLKDEERKNLVSQYNKGKLKALVVSSAGGEGLDLKGTRQVHVTEPHWNEAKIEQVIGRSARIGSHANLPENERKVDVFRYQSVLPEKRYGFLWLKKKRPVSADQYLDNLSKRKDQLNEEFMSVIKKANLSDTLTNYIVPSVVAGTAMGVGITAATSKNKKDFKANVQKGIGAGIAGDVATGFALAAWNKRKSLSKLAEIYMSTTPRMQHIYEDVPATLLEETDKTPQAAADPHAYKKYMIRKFLEKQQGSRTLDNGVK